MKTPALPVFLLFGFLLLVSRSVSAEGNTTRVSVGSGGVEANNYSGSPNLSADGRFVAFVSDADNLVLGDNNGFRDVFVHDRQTHATTRINVNSNGAEANKDSSPPPAISADGRFVAFVSKADNLVPGDNNGKYDVFVHDRETHITTRVNLNSNGAEASGDSAWSPALSADGRFVAFISRASNLVRADHNHSPDVFVHDRETGKTTRVSVNSDGVEGNDDSSAPPSTASPHNDSFPAPAISADGRYVAFVSGADNLVSNDDNGKYDVFVRDRQTGQTTRVNVNSDGEVANGDNATPPAISANGRFVAFISNGDNLVLEDNNGEYDVFVHDRETGQTTRVNVDSSGEEANGDSSAPPAISADGRFVAFISDASSLVPGDTNDMFDTFVHDRQTGRTTRVNVDSSGGQADDGGSWAVNLSLSADGRFVAFRSNASDLVPGDNNNIQDVYVRDRILDEATVNDLSVAATGAPSPIKPGKTLTYTFTLTNKGSEQVSGATLVDVLSSHLTLTEVSFSQGDCTTSHVLVCRLGNLGGGAKATVTVKARVKSTASGTFRNTVSTQANPRDPRPGNNRKVIGTKVAP
jgi:uncharacterized repeat protein (TIGR01451 family)